MASTSPWDIPLIDDSSVVNPIGTPLNAMAGALNDALTDLQAAVDEQQGYYIGTNAERLALVAPKLRNGITWFATDTNIVWERRSSEWVPRSPVAMAAGIATHITAAFPVVNLPAGRFTVPPIITAQLLSGAGADIGVGVMITNVTTTTFQCRHTAGSGTKSVAWHAIQMTPTTANG